MGVYSTSMPWKSATEASVASHSLVVSNKGQHAFRAALGAILQLLCRAGCVYVVVKYSIFQRIALI